MNCSTVPSPRSRTQCQPLPRRSKSPFSVAAKIRPWWTAMSSTVGSGDEVGEGLAAVARRVDAGERPGVVDGDHQLVAGHGEGGDAGVDHPGGRRPQRAAAVLGDPDAGPLGAEDHALRLRRVEGDRLHGDRRDRRRGGRSCRRRRRCGGRRRCRRAGGRWAARRSWWCGAPRSPPWCAPTCRRRPGCGRPSRRCSPRSRRACRRPGVRLKTSESRTMPSNTPAQVLPASSLL